MKEEYLKLINYHHNLIGRGNFSDAYARRTGRKCRDVTFIVTHECNLRCEYCYEISKSGKKMTLETAKRIVDYMFESDRTNGRWVNEEEAYAVILTFIGGEPLLEIDLIDDIMDYFLGKAISLNHRWMTEYMICMTTNGTLYDSPRVQRFVNKWNSRLSISVTVDGDQETHDTCRIDHNGQGSYDKAAGAFMDLRDKYGYDGTKFTIAPGNVDRVFVAVKDMITKFDLSRLMLNCVYEDVWNAKHANTLYNQLKAVSDWLLENDREHKTLILFFDTSIGIPVPDTETQNWCGGTGKMLAFDVNGEILPCLRYSAMSLSNHPPLIVGTLEDGIGVRPEHKKTIDDLEAITRQSQSEEKCLTCPISRGCGWCSALHYDTFGTPNKRTLNICQMHQARVLACVYHFNRLYRKYGVPLRFTNNVPYEWAKEILPPEEIALLTQLQSDD